MEATELNLETECLLFSEEAYVMGLTVSQAGDVPTELTVDRVAAALQDLQQHLEHSQKDLVMCAQCTQKSCLTFGLLDKHHAKARMDVSPCRGGWFTGMGRKEDHNHIHQYCLAALSHMGYFCCSVCSPFVSCQQWQ